MDCCESRTSLATTRRALLLGGASFAAWAYLPKFARAADGRDPRLIVVILRGALDGLATVAPVGDPDYAGLHGPIALAPDGPHAAPDARFLLRAASRRCRNSRGCTGRSMRRWSTRWRRRIATVRISTARTCWKADTRVPAGCNPAGSTARWKHCPAGRAGDERIGHRPDHAAGAARCCADRGLGAGGVAASRRRYRGEAGRPLPAPRSRACCGAVAGPATRQGGARRRHEAEARHQQCGRDETGGARRRQTDERG